MSTPAPKSDTPRTDAEAFDSATNIHHKGAFVEAEFARKLERENAALRAVIGHAWLHSAYKNCGYRQMTTEQKALYDSVTKKWHEDLNREGQAATQEVEDKLASIPVYPSQQTEWRGAEL